MEIFSQQILILLEAIIVASIVLIHISNKNTTAVVLYMIQSFAVVALFAIFSLNTSSFGSMLALLLMIVVKIIVAPYFFFYLINKYKRVFSRGSYLGVPATLIVLFSLALLSDASFFRPLVYLNPEMHGFILAPFFALLASIFLVINRKGTIIQTLGILSMENSIVCFTICAGLEQSPALEIGITFNMFIWIIISYFFNSMIYEKFGPIDVGEMKNLTE